MYSGAEAFRVAGSVRFGIAERDANQNDPTRTFPGVGSYSLPSVNIYQPSAPMVHPKLETLNPKPETLNSKT